ncbi:MAG TPA: hypothetical protein VG847_15950 [Chitinophagaceae bacterium]|nr:hypothetical protein [Chitinophagaceae bacterium]
MKSHILIPVFTLAAINISLAQNTISKPVYVYVVGKEYNEATKHNTIKYWKNEEAVTVTDGAYNAEPTAIFVTDNNDVYVSGYETRGKTNIAQYWKNSRRIALSDATQNAKANSIFVSGNNVYVSGTINNEPVLWKNNIPQKLPLNGIKKISISSVIVSGSDVYVFGSGNNGEKDILLYWKNGTLTQITDSASAYAQSAFISGNDIYIAGFREIVTIQNGETMSKRNMAAYWKNGIVHPLSDSLDAIALSIYVSGNDVYITGVASDVEKNFFSALYWKNGTLVPVSRSEDAGFNSIYVAGNDVYMAGGMHPEFNDRAMYWKNGQAVPLSDGSHNAVAIAITVK